MNQTPEQIPVPDPVQATADALLKSMPPSSEPSDVYPFVLGWIGSVVDSDRSDAECRERIRLSLAAVDVVRQRLRERRRTGA